MGVQDGQVIATAEDQMQLAVANIINKVAAGAEAATEFVIAETPDVIQQLLMWNMVERFLCFIIGVLILCSMIIGFSKCVIPTLKEKWAYDEGEAFIIAAVAAIGSVVPAIVGCALINLDWLKIWIAPKVWLLEYASQLVK